MSEPKFMHYFAVHLASRLLGTDIILQRFEEASLSENRSFRLYWRSPLLVEIDPSQLTPPQYHSSTALSDNDGDGWRMIFFDVTFDFTKPLINVSTSEGGAIQKQQSHPRVHVKFGAFLESLSKRCGLYVKNKPLELRKLENHMEQIDIDLDDSDPQPVAFSMAEALLDFAFIKADDIVGTRRTSIAVVRETSTLNTVDQAKVAIPLFYRKFSDCSPDLKVEQNESTMILPPETTSMLIANFNKSDFTKNCNTKNNTPPSTNDVKKATAALKRWYSDMTDKQESKNGAKGSNNTTNRTVEQLDKFTGSSKTAGKSNGKTLLATESNSLKISSTMTTITKATNPYIHKQKNDDHDNAEKEWEAKTKNQSKVSKPKKRIAEGHGYAQVSCVSKNKRKKKRAKIGFLGADDDE